jgi:cell division protein FtsB
MASAVWGDRGMLHLWRLQAELRDAQSTAQRLQRGNEALRERLRRVRSDPASLERVVRERFGWVREGEIVYRVDERTSR